MRTRSSKRSKKNRGTFWSLIVIVIIAGGAGYYYYNKLQASRNVVTPVATTTIGTGDIVLTATGPGALASSEQISFGFKSSGQVSEVLGKLGDTVKAGQVLAKLDSATLELAYAEAQANLDALSSPAQIAAARQTVQDDQQSFATARNNLQYLIGPEMLFAQEKVADAQQALQLAQAAVEKDPTTEDKQKVTGLQAALDNAQQVLTYAQYNFASNYTVDTFTYPIRNDNGVTVRKELIAPTDAAIQSAQAAYDNAKANLTDAQDYLDVLLGTKTTDEVPASSVTAITEAQNALDKAKADLDATELKAPIDGTITSLTLNVGDNPGNSAVVTISNLSQPYKLDVNLDETDWDKAVVGYEATVTFDLLPNKTFSGKIIQVYPALDASSGIALIHVVVQLDSTVNVDLPAGATASVDVTGGKALGVIVAPITALQEVQPGQYVVFLMKNGKPVQQPVEVGLQSIVNVEIKSGLKPGDVVLTDATSSNQ